jgi:peptide chain release factor
MYVARDWNDEGSSMVTFAVSPEKNHWLQEKMKALHINDEDLEEKFIRSAGRGGQKVNKTSSCVYIRHIPTGIEVKCMRERSQSVNRFLARRVLVERVERLSGQPTTTDMRREKVRKQKQKLRKRAVAKHKISAGGTHA